MRQIIVDPDPRLRKICKEVTDIDAGIKSLVKELLEMIADRNNNPEKYETGAVGIAAPQVGELIQLFVIDTPSFSLTLINPRITKTAGSHRVYESCLSLPGRMFLVERPKVVKVKGMDIDGNQRTVKVHDFLAQAVIHEIHHLRGILLDNVAIAEVDGEC